MQPCGLCIDINNWISTQQIRNRGTDTGPIQDTGNQAQEIKTEYDSKIYAICVNSIFEGPALEVYKNGDTIEFLFEKGVRHGSAYETLGRKNSKRHFKTIEFTYYLGEREGKATEIQHNIRIKNGKSEVLAVSTLEFIYAKGVRRGPATLTDNNNRVKKFTYDGLEEYKEKPKSVFKLAEDKIKKAGSLHDIINAISHSPKLSPKISVFKRA